MLIGLLVLLVIGVLFAALTLGSDSASKGLVVSRESRAVPEERLTSVSDLAKLKMESLFAPVTSLGEGDPLVRWRWLIGDKPVVLMATAFGNCFCRMPDGRIRLLDTYACSFDDVAESHDDLNRKLKDPTQVGAWFLPGLLDELASRGSSLAEGTCFSPFVPPLLSGRYDPSNFRVRALTTHLAFTGSISEQIKDWPDGERVEGFSLE